MGYLSPEFQSSVFARQTHNFGTRRKKSDLKLPFFNLKRSKNSIFSSGITF